MDDRGFDNLTRTLGAATSRRQVLKGLLGAAVGRALLGIGVRAPQVLAAVPTCDGVPYDPASQCCEPAGVQPRYPIADLAKCPNRVPYPGHVPAFNGCGPENGFLKYFIPNRIGPLRNIDFTPACNHHDICYDTCNSDKVMCDANFFLDLEAACTSAYPGSDWYQTYMRTVCIQVYARAYYTAVARGGQGAYDDAQKEACDCCPACADCTGPTQQCCNNQCVDVASDPANCGACGKACRSDQVCADSTCQCPAGQTDCNGACVDLEADHANCGTCGHACSACETCSAGTCEPAPDGTACGSNLVCCDGQCVAGTSCDACAGQPDGTACGTGQVCCSGTCCSSGQSCCQGVCQNSSQGCCDDPVQVCYGPDGQPTGECCPAGTGCHAWVDGSGENSCCPLMGSDGPYPGDPYPALPGGICCSGGNYYAVQCSAGNWVCCSGRTSGANPCNRVCLQ